MTRRSLSAALVDPRRRALDPPQWAHRHWLIWTARVVLTSVAVTIGATAVLVIVFGLWPSLEPLGRIAARWLDGNYP